MGIKNRRQEKQRGRKKRERRRIMLIATEGRNKTEEKYFAEFRSLQKEFAIQFADGDYTDIGNITNCLERKMKAISFDSSVGDMAFCVVDLDADRDRIERASAKLEEMANTNISYALSNPCFEIWFLNHFEYSTACFKDSDAVVRKLQRYIPGYHKSLNPQNALLGKTGDAIQNAKKLQQYHDDQGRKRASVDANPMTEVHEIVGLLLQSLDKSK